MDRVVPISSPPGSTIAIHGSGFEAPIQVQVNGANATVTLATSSEVNFTIPANCDSGAVAIRISGIWHTNPVPFTVTRLIQGKFEPPTGITRGGYDVICDGEFVAVDAASGQFTGAVAKEGVSVLWAVRGENEADFLALVPPSTNQPTVNAASTAEALVLLSPAIDGKSIERYNDLAGQLRTLPQFNELVSVIGSASAAGRDYLDDARVLNAWENALMALLTANPPAELLRQQGFEPDTISGTKLRYLDAPHTSQGTTGRRRLKAEVSGPDSQHPDDFRIGFGHAGRFAPFFNPLDWFIKVYELDPNQFANGFKSVGALSSNALPAKLGGSLVDNANVSASLISRNLDLLDIATAALSKLLFSYTVDAIPGVRQPNEVDVQALRPAVYVAEAYSGNIYNGTEIFNHSPPSQSQLISDLGGRASWGVSAGANVTIAAVDVIGAFGGFIEVYKKSRSGSNADETRVLFQIYDGVARDVIKALAIHGNQPLSGDTINDLLKNAASSLLKNMLGKAMENPASVPFGDRLKTTTTRTLKKLAASVDIVGKVSSALQAIERVGGLAHPSVLGVERSVLVIGNPFAPRITSFLPASGRGGEVLLIQGANFSSNTNELNVSFRQFASTDDPAAYTKRLDLEILSATPTSIAVRVPTNGAAYFQPTPRAFLVVEKGSTNLVGSSAALNPPYREFRFKGLPTVTSVFPDPARPGGLIEIQGTGFDGSRARNHEISIGDMDQAWGYTADDTRLVVRLPTSLAAGAHTLSLSLQDISTVTITFQVQDPIYTSVPGQGYTITATKGDFSNVADGKISVLEAILIAKGELGRPIEEHLPCEYLSPDDPGYCPYRERETDHISGNSGGAGVADTIRFADGLVINGPLPPLSEGDQYFFGSTPANAVTLDGSSAGSGAAGLLLDGTANIRLGGYLVIQNFSGHGVHARNGAYNNLFENISVRNCGGHGVFLEGDAALNEFRHTSVSNVLGHGICLSGPAVRLNDVSTYLGGGSTVYHAMSHCGGNGIRVDNGANFNTINPGSIRNCGAAGIHVSGAGTANNSFGRNTDELARAYNLVNNGGPGAYIGPGAVGNVFRYLNPVGNQGDGVLLEGPGCSNNVIDRTFAGPNLYEGGTSLTIGNQGSGIRLRQGAQFNLIGTRTVAFGELGSIVGNRDDGITLEGPNTAYNTVNQQVIGVLNPFAFSHFAGNGLSGIALRNGAHDNQIGDVHLDLANVLFTSAAAIELRGNGTERNLVVGNEIGCFHIPPNIYVGTGVARNGTGIWIHDGARNNIIGLPGQRVPVRRFPGDNYPPYYQAYNLIETCTNAGVLLENTSGHVSTDGILSLANVIQGNRIGELDNGNLAPSGEVGIKIGPGAEANIIGGPLPEQGNRIRGWTRAAIWMDQNHLSGPRMRNRFQNNYIEGPGSGFNHPNYLSQTPVGHMGFLITSCTGQTVGESLTTRNTIRSTRIAFYMADSSSNTVRAFYITNNFNAGLVVRGGTANRIGGGSPGEGNLIHASGLLANFPWSGLALSHTSGNVVRGNEIGFLAPGRGSIGIFITNASDNLFGGAAMPQGNIVVGGLTNGIVLSGAGAFGNKFFNNSIGVDRNGTILPNLGNGILIENGAHDNFIGGLAEISTVVSGIPISGPVPSGNVIAHNGRAGVRVSGASTVGNRILYNEITSNEGKGIQHEEGGNTLQPTAIPLSFDGSAVSGIVGSLANTPAGSLIQLFSDADTGDPEGDAFLGEATVQTNGTWRALLTGTLLHPLLTVTATDGVDGSTSEFGIGNPTNIFIKFQMARTDSLPEETIAAGANKAAVFRLSLSAVNADVRVNSLSFDTAGTLVDPAHVLGASLFHDSDQDGSVTAADFPLAGPATFGVDDGSILFTNINQVVAANSTQRWVVAYQLHPEAPTGSTFLLVLTNAAVVSAKYVNPINLSAVPEGSFAIQSAQFTVGAAPAGQTFAAWQASVFTPEQLEDPFFSDPSADADGDGLNTLGEYAYNLNPLLPDRTNPGHTEGGVPQAWLSGSEMKITFVRRKEPVDLLYEADQGDLQAWTNALTSPAFLTLDTQVDIGTSGTLERVTYRTTQPVAGGAIDRFVRIRVRFKQ